MKTFLFITHLTPKHLRSSLREGLIENMVASLHSQSWRGWKALWIGEDETTDGVIKTVRARNDAELREVYRRPDVLEFMQGIDYFVKLDDDDVIMPRALERAAGYDFDCYYDALHVFYDVSSGKLSRQRRPWIPSTCIHQRSHAMMSNRGNGIAENFVDSVFYGDHSIDWKRYYEGKRQLLAPAGSELYVRILSPTSKTAGDFENKVFSFSDVNMDVYRKYLATFGSWKMRMSSEFVPYHLFLCRCWETFSGKPQLPLKLPSASSRLLNRIFKKVRRLTSRG